MTLSPNCRRRACYSAPRSSAVLSSVLLLGAAATPGSTTPKIKTIDAVLTVSPDRTAGEFDRDAARRHPEGQRDPRRRTASRDLYRRMEELDLIEAYTHKADGRRIDVRPTASSAATPRLTAKEAYLVDQKALTVFLPGRVRRRHRGAHDAAENPQRLPSRSSRDPGSAFARGQGQRRT